MESKSGAMKFSFKDFTQMISGLYRVRSTQWIVGTVITITVLAGIAGVVFVVSLAVSNFRGRAAGRPASSKTH